MTRVVSAAILAQGQDTAPSDTVAVIGDRRLSVAALVAVLLGNPSYRLAREARGSDEVRQALMTFRPTVILMETVGTAWRDAIDGAQLTGRTLLLLDPEEDAAVFDDAVRSHAAGYLSRTASREALEKAIDSIRQTGHHLDPLLVSRMLTVGSVAPMPTRDDLSRRELDILVRIASGRSTKEVAREFSIAAKTVGNHVSNICQKLNLNHRGELVLYAVERGLVAG